MKSIGITMLALGVAFGGFAGTQAVRANMAVEQAASNAGDLQASERVAPTTAPRTTNAPLAPLDPNAMKGLRDATASYYLAPGETLRGALTRWCADADYQLVWQSDQDFVVDSQMSFPRGSTFEDAVRQTIRAVWRQHPTLKAETYKNRVLVISANEVEK